MDPDTTIVLWQDQAVAEVSAPLSTVWALVSDVQLMGDWSPVCKRCEYVDGATRSALGVRFVGHNRQAGARWSRTCVITTCEPERELAFHTVFRGEPGTRWRYQLEPTAGGTRVTESYELLAMPRWVRLLQRVPGMTRRSRRDTQRGMKHTLAGIKATAESGHDLH